MNSKFCDLYAEKSVIGGILNATGEYTDLASSAIETLSEDDFTAVSNKLILRALKRMNHAGAKIDLIMVNSELEQCGDSKNSGGFPYLAECAKDLPSIHMLPGYVEKVKQLSLARRTISILQDGISRINESGVNHVHDIAGKIQEEISNVSNNQVTETQHIMSGVEESLSIIESMISGDIWKYKTEFGLPDIDQAFGGFNNTDFIVIGGRPGMGKTMLSTTITKSVGLAKSKPVLFYSLEMPSWQISERVAFHHARVDKESILGKEKSKMHMDEAWARLSSSLAEIKDSPIYINDKPSMSIHEIRADARRMHKKTGGLGVIIVDYLQKMKMSNPENMNQSVGEIATGLKNLAKELKCPVVALAQLNRNLEQRTNKRPGNADLRESGVIEQEADVIFMIYRDEKYNPDTELKGITEVICTKSRHAPGAEKTYYFTNTHGGLDTADLSRAFMDRYSDADIEC
ncbi:replicative DNA helicase [Providencia stuartii]|uniref:replicative DNA helicase n=1 Tax=Providencia TaxID=586 RepID=UPI0029906153|nr:replicative DNA helicase [Providencia sp. PROV080]ELX8377563.1 replicative DNA helicase [Providencia stuartii]EMD5257104.1 replicative DNA helicase [Providencia stuartii]